jgi:hypothetical protein
MVRTSSSPRLLERNSRLSGKNKAATISSVSNPNSEILRNNRESLNNRENAGEMMEKEIKGQRLAMK